MRDSHGWGHPGEGCREDADDLSPPLARRQRAARFLAMEAQGVLLRQRLTSGSYPLHLPKEGICRAGKLTSRATLVVEDSGAHI